MLGHCWAQHRSLLVVAAAGGDVAVAAVGAGAGDADGVAGVPSSGDGHGHVVGGEEIGVDDGVDFGGDPLGILENP